MYTCTVYASKIFYLIRKVYYTAKLSGIRLSFEKFGKDKPTFFNMHANFGKVYNFNKNNLFDAGL